MRLHMDNQMKIDKTVHPLEMVVKLIKQTNPNADFLPLGDSSRYSMEVLSSESETYNSKVIVTSTGTASHKGRVELNYNRISQLIDSSVEELILEDDGELNWETVEEDKDKLRELIICHLDEVEITVVSPSVVEGSYEAGLLTVKGKVDAFTVTEVEQSIPINWRNVPVSGDLRGDKFVEVITLEDHELDPENYSSWDPISKQWNSGGTIVEGVPTSIRMNKDPTSYIAMDDVEGFMGPVMETVEITAWGDGIEHLGFLGIAITKVPDTLPKSITSLKLVFASAQEFNQDISGWDTSNVTDMTAAFQGAEVFNQPIGNWDVSKVLTTYCMFLYTGSFNQDLSGWDVSNIKYMSSMFDGADAFNQDLSSWCVSHMPEEPTSFKDTYDGAAWTLPKPVWGTCPRGEDVGREPDPRGDKWVEIKTHVDLVLDEDHYSHWDAVNQAWVNGGTVKAFKTTSIRMTNTPEKYIGYIEGSLSPTPYDIVKVITDWGDGIEQLSYLGKQVSTIPMWTPKSLNNLSSVFVGSKSLTSSTFDWDTSKVTTLAHAFRDSSGYEVTSDAWDVSSVTDMSFAFKNSNFSQSLRTWDVSNVTNMEDMFSGCDLGQGGLYLDGWDVSNVTNMDGMFRDVTIYPGTILSNWCVTKIAAEPVDFSNYVNEWEPWESKPVWGTCPVRPLVMVRNPDKSITVVATSNAIPGKNYKLSNQMYYVVKDKEDLIAKTDLFKSQAVYREINIVDDFRQGGQMTMDRLVITNVTDLSDLFLNNETITNDISPWDTSNVTNMDGMFNGAIKFNVDLSMWCVSKITEEPLNFATNAQSWTLPKPVWGTCPREEDN